MLESTENVQILKNYELLKVKSPGGTKQLNNGEEPLSLKVEKGETTTENSHLNNEIHNCKVQSARNYLTGSSETLRQLSKLEKSERFNKWLAGVQDGDGNFEVRKINGEFKLKAIKIKLHNNDIRIQNRILDHQHYGRVRIVPNKPYSYYIVSSTKEMKDYIERINGLIRLKVSSFKKACDSVGVKPKEANYNIEPLDPYLAGLIDTDGSIVYNYASNRIECNLEQKYNEYSKKLNLNNVIPYSKPYILLRRLNKTNQRKDKVYQSIAFKYQTVNEMMYVYDYFRKNRLYSDKKYYRVLKIKPFITIRSFKNSEYNSNEYKIYSNFIQNWIKYKNTNWVNTPFINKLNRDK